MAKSISEEELQLRKRARRRLIGAIASVAIVVVFLPMVLDHEPKPASQDISIQIPAPNNSGNFTSKIVPVTPSTPSSPSVSDATPAPAVVAKSEPVAKTEPEAKAEPVAKQPAVPVIQPPVYDSEAAPVKKSGTDKVAQDKAAQEKAKVAAKTAKPVAKSAPAPKVASTKPDAKSSGAYVVQVAALNDADKAKEMQAKITSAGVKSYTEVVPTTKGNVTRVRAGPFATRQDAEKMRDKLKELGLAGNIVPK